MEKLNFSWLVENEIAGCRESASDGELRYLKDCGLGALVRLVEKHLSQVTSEQVARARFAELHSPIPDYGAPAISQIEKILDFIRDSVARGRAVGVCCGHGYGRTGTILACYLVGEGWTADEAIQEVRVKRPGSIETEAQEETVRLFAEHQSTGVDGEKQP